MPKTELLKAMICASERVENPVLHLCPGSSVVPFLVCESLREGRRGGGGGASSGCFVRLALFLIFPVFVLLDLYLNNGYSCI